MSKTSTPIERIDKGVAFDRFEYVDVTFGAANTDHVVTLRQLRPNAVEDVRWLDITPNAATSTVPAVYRSTAATALAWGTGYIVLRCTVADYSTRLFLFLERA